MAKQKCSLYPNLKIGDNISILHKNGMHFDNVSYEGHDCIKKQLYFSWRGELQINPVDVVDIKSIKKSSQEKYI